MRTNDGRMKQIRLYRLIQAFAKLCGQRLKLLDTALAVDDNFFVGAEAVLIAVQQRLLMGDSDDVALAHDLAEIMNPSWDKNKDE